MFSVKYFNHIVKWEASVVSRIIVTCVVWVCLFHFLFCLHFCANSVC